MSELENDPEIIVEVDADGNEYRIDIGVCNDAADDVLHSLFELEGTLEDFDFSTAVFGLLVNAIHILTTSGWTTSDLVTVVNEHSEYVPPNAVMH